jgi:ATP-dependent helicase/DNAse subunit B
LQDPALVAEAARAFAPDSMWSATKINDYGVCGFRFFAKRLLGLEELQEPEAGMTPAQRGTLNHNILEETYRRVRSDGLTISPDNADAALAILRDAARVEFARAPQHIGFQTPMAWEQEQAAILRKLEALVQSDFAGAGPVSKFGDVGRQPYQVEASFGFEKSAPVTLDLGEAGTLRLRGRIDRMDRIGDSVVIIDYKSGSSTIPTSEMQAGRNFQMLVYLLAAQELLQRNGDTSLRVAGGLFWHLPNRTASGTIRVDNDKDADAIDAAMEHLARYVADGRAGDFTVHPSKLDGDLCVRYCELRALCRHRTTSRRKRQAADSH